jgi:hypothetical protein
LRFEFSNTRIFLSDFCFQLSNARVFCDRWRFAIRGTVRFYEPVISNRVIDVVEANREMLLLFAVVEVKREST